jgi:hypothetical protein
VHRHQGGATGARRQADVGEASKAAHQPLVELLLDNFDVGDGLRRAVAVAVTAHPGVRQRLNL